MTWGYRTPIRFLFHAWSIRSLVWERVGLPLLLAPDQSSSPFAMIRQLGICPGKDTPEPGATDGSSPDHRGYILALINIASGCKSSARRGPICRFRIDLSVGSIATGFDSLLRRDPLEQSVAHLHSLAGAISLMYRTLWYQDWAHSDWLSFYHREYKKDRRMEF